MLWKIEKKSEENKNKLRKMYPNNHEKFSEQFKSNFTGSYRKNSVL